jgi:hypothetical protein
MASFDYDVIVIGFGFGGSVVGCARSRRFARPGDRGRNL